MPNTNTFSSTQIKRNWHLVDAKGKILGRLATDVAKKIRGKDKASFVPYLDNGDYVVVINAAQIKVTGNKGTQKMYVRHSGYPGGLRVESFDSLIKRQPEKVITHAIHGMLPKTKLGKEMIKKLFVYPTSTHPHQKQIKGEEK